MPITELPPAQQAEVLVDAAGWDTEWAAAIYILTAGGSWRFAREDRIRRHIEVSVSVVDPGAARMSSMDIPAMVAEQGWSESERIMVRAAGALFNGDTPCDLRELGRLDDFNERVVLQAVDLRHRRATFETSYASQLRRHVAPQAVTA